MSVDERPQYPRVLDAGLAGTYPASAHAGGGYVWDAVLEYRVWCHSERGAPDEAGGGDGYIAFAEAEDAVTFSRETHGPPTSRPG